MNESYIRVGFFLSFLICLCVLESKFPRKKLVLTRKLRWTNNISLVILDNLIVRFALPISTIFVAQWAQNNNVGLFHQIQSVVKLPNILFFVLAILILDLIIYGQHILFHRWSVLWKLHRVHHADMDIDVTTASRFHPIEIIMSIGIKLAAILVFGISPFAILCFEIILNSSAMFNHANWRLPYRVDHLLRKIVVTPDMHRVHHSIHPLETHSNFGFFLSIWDQIFKTYRETPQDGHNDMLIGIPEFRDPKYSVLHRLLMLPFINEKIVSSEDEIDRKTA